MSRFNTPFLRVVYCIAVPVFIFEMLNWTHVIHVHL
jgi:hypothetical protein